MGIQGVYLACQVLLKVDGKCCEATAHMLQNVQYRYTQADGTNIEVSYI